MLTTDNNMCENKCDAFWHICLNKAVGCPEPLHYVELTDGSYTPFDGSGCKCEFNYKDNNGDFKSGTNLIKSSSNMITDDECEWANSDTELCSKYYSCCGDWDSWLGGSQACGSCDASCSSGMSCRNNADTSAKDSSYCSYSSSYCSGCYCKPDTDSNDSEPLAQMHPGTQPSSGNGTTCH